MQVSRLVKKKNIFGDLEHDDRDGVLREMLGNLRDNGDLAEEDVGKVYDGLISREKLGTTGIGKGIAIPHVRYDGLKDLLLAVGRSERGIDFAAVDGERVTVVFLVLCPESRQDEYLAVLRWISSVARDDYNNKLLLGASTPKDFIELFQDIEESA